MEQLIEAFGIDIKLIVVQIVNFVILVGLLSYFLYKPLLRLLDDRAEKIKQGIADTEAAARAKAEADQEKQKTLSEAHEEAKAVHIRAREAAEERANSIIADAENRQLQILKEAEKRSEELKVRAQKDSDAEIAKLAILAAEKILSQKAS